MGRCPANTMPAYRLGRACFGNAAAFGIESGGLNQTCDLQSAYVRDPFLGFRIGCCDRLRRKLEYRGFLTFKHVSEQHPLPIWRFQGIMVHSRVVLG